jgi:hypothetical protein
MFSTDTMFLSDYVLFVVEATVVAPVDMDNSMYFLKALLSFTFSIPSI